MHGPILDRSTSSNQLSASLSQRGEKRETFARLASVQILKIKKGSVMENEENAGLDPFHWFRASTHPEGTSSDYIFQNVGEILIDCTKQANGIVETVKQITKDPQEQRAIAEAAVNLMNWAVDAFGVASEAVKDSNNKEAARLALCKMYLVGVEASRVAIMSKKNDVSVEDAIEEISRRARQSVARRGANAVHDKPGGNREKQNRIRSIWASGKYSSRAICAEQECAALGMSYDAARKALRNTPNPG